ncbi:MAG: penicillin-binding protein 2 [Chitinophagaceae bacterium]|nr:penicillin-binding protein 2 [Chitinophagaceae bacterium]
MPLAANSRELVLKIIFISVATIILSRLFYLQLFEDKYKVMADDIAIMRKIVYPPRGVIYDRKGKVMLNNEVVYDLVVTPIEAKKRVDTLRFCEALGIDTTMYGRLMHRAINKSGWVRQTVFLEQLSEAQAARFQENIFLFNGFQMVERNIRSYPDPHAGVVLGYIGEVSPSMLKRDRFKSYNQGDYVGIDGLELAYEEILRGQRGIYYIEKDNFNRPRDSYKGGALDSPAMAGRSIELHLDADLQAYGENLMANKLGSVVAIDPATGGVLAMVSSPSYNPNLLRGKERSRNFGKLFLDATKPLFNRAMKGSYNPGSTQKPLTALVALDENVITPSFGYPCGGGYYACGKRIGCTHSGGGHAANLRAALANSCNSYFVHIYRLAVDKKAYGNVKAGLHKFYEHMYAFGLGHPLGIDLPGEKGGPLYDVKDYDKMYNGSWNSCTNLFVGMGQGEIATTPLQMANAMCIIANKGFYYTPHFVKSVANNANDPILAPFKIKHKTTNISDSAYAIVGLGMMDVVDKGTGAVARLPGVEVCAKTGTVENKAVVNGQVMKLQNHSMFVAYAPRINPKIASAVVVENAGYGATWAGPVASLMIEKYLNDTIATSRKGLQEKMFNANVIPKYTYIIDSATRLRDKMIWERKQHRLKYQESVKHYQDSLQIRLWIKKNLM